MRNLYELHKAFVFRTLWEGNSPLTSFQRLASESALGTGRLNGAVELTNVLQNLKQLQDKAVKCFTNNIFAAKACCRMRPQSKVLSSGPGIVHMSRPSLLSTRLQQVELGTSL